MKTNANKKRIITFIIIFIWIFITFSTVIIFIYNKNEHTRLKMSSKADTIDKWIINGKEEKFPYTFKNTDNNNILATTTLPKKIKENSAIMLNTMYFKYKFYIDNKQIYSYGFNTTPFGSTVGNIQLVVPLKPSYANKKLSIEFTQMCLLKNLIIGETFSLPVVYLGDEARLKSNLLHENMWRLFVCIFLATVGILCVGIAIYQIVLGSFHVNSLEFLYFGGFTLGIMTWVLCNSDLTQFVLNKNSAVEVLSYIALPTLAILYLGYCKEILQTNKKFFSNAQKAGCLIPLTIILFYMFNLLEPLQILIITHLYVLFVIISTLTVTIKERKKNPYSKILLISLIVFVFFTCTGFAFFYILPLTKLYAIFFSAGFIIYTILMIAVILIREVNFIQERLSLDIYKEMAYIDKLTGCGNRAALEIEFENGITMHNHKYITLVLIDLNHLKRVNDTLGHDAGDELICAGATCLLEGFDPSGQVFRLGGDEFAIIIWNEKGKIQKYFKKLDESISNYNSHNKLHVSLAKGYFECECENKPGFFKEIYRNADQNMYIDKERCHKMLADENIINSNK